MSHKIIISGFGGQGILSAGILIAHAGLCEGKNVSWIPSYGPEMRGGSANCHIIVSDQQIGSPIINQASALICMSTISYTKFSSLVSSAGIILIDSSIVDRSLTKETSTQIVEVPATSIASEMGNTKFANVILLGKLLSLTNVVSKASLESALKKVLPINKQHLISQEIVALDRGMAFETSTVK